MKGDQQVYPRSISGSHMGITYRQYLAGQVVAGGHITNAIGKHTAEDFLAAYGTTVWALTDAILEAENPLEQHET